MSKKVCPECGALVAKPKKHRRWHFYNRPIPGPQGPPGPMGIAGLPHARWEDVKAEREGQTKQPANSLLDAVMAVLREQAQTKR